MKLLIVTQTVDDGDPVLGFFTRWIEKLASDFERIEVICLSEGKHMLPENVRVHTLGKENTGGGKRKIGKRVRYVLRFITLAWKLRREYDTVFVHMNQEYVLIGALLWKLLSKRIYMWRNHGSGSWPTHLAALWCRRVFYTSSASYTARFRNALRMPVGVDLERFSAPAGASRLPGSILMAGRVSPKKHVREVVEALLALQRDGTQAALTLAGPMDDAAYRDKVVGLANSGNIGLSVRGAVPHAELSRIYAEHDIVVNISAPGMFDKTMLEALASGCLLLTRHEDLSGVLDPRLSTSGEVPDIAQKIRTLLRLSQEEKDALREEGKRVARAHDLNTLVAQLAKELYA
ncbi:MAG: glycosyltransferase family 4 protein [Candidatus Pacebacteria bacterium]|nr:glycosyltransferase family 4 protein [Candidatus Paceibacterota bacterium]MBP9840728.1 glycosyltransferase family 4 protein [Candidatus Paceibacterota bacterium]